MYVLREPLGGNGAEAVCVRCDNSQLASVRSFVYCTVLHFAFGLNLLSISIYREIDWVHFGFCEMVLAVYTML